MLAVDTNPFSDLPQPIELTPADLALQPVEVPHVKVGEYHVIHLPGFANRDWVLFVEGTFTLRSVQSFTTQSEAVQRAIELAAE